jgi:hypothetical protein
MIPIGAWTFQGQVTALTICITEGEHFVYDDSARPSVGDDVVVRANQSVVCLPCSEEGQADKGCLAQVKSFSSVQLQEFAESAFLICWCQISPILLFEGEGGVGMHILHRFAGSFPSETGSQDRVSCQDLFPGPLEGCHVQRFVQRDNDLLDVQP